MPFNDLFTVYNSLDPPEGYEDNFYIPRVQEIEEPMIAHVEYSNDQNIDLEPPYEIKMEEPAKQKTALKVVDLARQYLDKPYIYGAMDPNKGFDCSGLINYVYSQVGIQLPRTSHAIGKVGKPVQLSEVQPGDIIYTTSKGPSGGHVKMVSKVQNGQVYVIEAKNRKYGITEGLLKNTSNIVSIRRILDTTQIEPSSNIQPQTNNVGRFTNKSNFIKTLNATYQQVLQERGLDPRYSYILTASAAMESGWGKHVSGNYNYGGVKAKQGSVKMTTDYVNGKYVRRYQTFRNYTSVRDYCNYVITLLSNKRYNAFNTYSANEPMKFWRHVLDAGYGGGDNAGKNRYMNSMQKIYNDILRNV